MVRINNDGALGDVIEDIDYVLREIKRLLTEGEL
jgi:hypothetical protein